jgi:hypothetical protein
MTRVLLQYLLPLLLPTVIYLVWWYLIGRATSAPGVPAPLREGPWFWLILAGVALMAAGLIVTAMMSGTDPTGTYVPPTWQGDTITPGRFK